MTLRPANIARYERDSDADLINTWLRARGFRRPPTGERGDADEPLLEND